MSEKFEQFVNGAGDENRTRVISLEGWNSTIELHLQILVGTFNYTLNNLYVNMLFQKLNVNCYSFVTQSLINKDINFCIF